MAAIAAAVSGCRVLYGDDDESAPAGCGDGAVDPGEACDDGNSASGDGCGPNCALENQGPGGNSCASATPLILVPTGVGSKAAFATGDTNDSSSDFDASCTSIGPDQAFSVVVDGTGTLNATLSGSTNVVLIIRDAGCARTTELCIDNRSLGVGEEASLEVAPGTFYVIADGRTESDRGVFEIGVTFETDSL